MGPREILQDYASGEMTHEAAAEAFGRLHAGSTSSEVSGRGDEGGYSEERPLVVWGGSVSVEVEGRGGLEDVSRPHIQGEGQSSQSNEGRSPRNREESSRFRGEREEPQAIQAIERQIASEEPTSSDRGYERESSKTMRVWSGAKRVGSFVKGGFLAMSEFAAEHPKKFIFTFTGISTVASVGISILAENGFWAVAGDAVTTFGVAGTSSLLLLQPVLAKFHNWREGRKRE